MSQTHFSCDTVDHELWLIKLSLLLFPETVRNMCIGKQAVMYFILPILRSDGTFSCFVPDISQCVNSCFDIKQWFSAYQDQVCAWFSLARLPNEAARKLFLYHFLNETALSFFSGYSNLFNASARLSCTLTFAQ